MAPRNIQTSCPQCSSPVQVAVEQIFDVAEDPAAKQRLLSGGANRIACPTCQFQGMYPTPMAFHDHEKELLLTR
jgi:hypothetical protein